MIGFPDAKCTLDHFSWGKGRYSLILRHTGKCCSNGCFFTRNLLTRVPFSAKISPNLGPFSKIFKCSPCKHPKIVKNGPLFWEISLKMGTFFCQMTHQNRYTHFDGSFGRKRYPFSTKLEPQNPYRGFKARAPHPCLNQIEYPWFSPFFLPSSSLYFSLSLCYLWADILWRLSLGWHFVVKLIEFIVSEGEGKGTNN